MLSGGGESGFCRRRGIGGRLLPPGRSCDRRSLVAVYVLPNGPSLRSAVANGGYRSGARATGACSFIDHDAVREDLCYEVRMIP